MTKKELANGAIASMSYDAADRLELLQDLKSTGLTISSHSYTYDKVGTPKEVLENTGDRGFG